MSKREASACPGIHTHRPVAVEQLLQFFLGLVGAVVQRELLAHSQRPFGHQGDDRWAPGHQQLNSAGTVQQGQRLLIVSTLHGTSKRHGMHSSLQVGLAGVVDAARHAAPERAINHAVTEEKEAFSLGVHNAVGPLGCKQAHRCEVVNGKDRARGVLPPTTERQLQPSPSVSCRLAGTLGSTTFQPYSPFTPRSWRRSSAAWHSASDMYSPTYRATKKPARACAL